MIYISNNGFIHLARGDSFNVPLFINRGTVWCPIRYYIEEDPNAKIYLGVMEPNQPFEEAIIRKIYTKDSEKTEFGDIIIGFDPNDTLYLLPGKYYYEIKLERGDKTVDTVVPKTEFVIE